MFKTSFQIAKIFGIPIRVDLSLLVLMGLIWYWHFKAVSEYVLVMQGTAIRPDEIGPLLRTAFVMGGVDAFVLLLSITLHELGHSLVSKRFGCRVRSITLMLLGGRAELSHLPTRPSQEFAIAIAGPLVSLTLWLVGHYGAGWLGAHPGHRTSVVFTDDLEGILAMLGNLNACLFWFNLVPAFPMDGGRVLRALLAHRLGRLRATRVAVMIGRGLAMAAIVWILMPGPTTLVLDAHTMQIAGTTWTIGPLNMPFNPYMLGLIALFIFQAAGQEYKMVQMEEYYRVNGLRPPWMPPPPPVDQVFVSPPLYRRERRDRIDLDVDDHGDLQDAFVGFQAAGS